MHRPSLTFYIVGEIARRQSLQGVKCPAFNQTTQPIQIKNFTFQIIYSISVLEDSRPASSPFFKDLDLDSDSDDSDSDLDPDSDVMTQDSD